MKRQGRPVCEAEDAVDINIDEHQYDLKNGKTTWIKVKHETRRKTVARNEKIVFREKSEKSKGRYEKEEILTKNNGYTRFSRELSRMAGRKLKENLPSGYDRTEKLEKSIDIWYCTRIFGWKTKRLFFLILN